MNAPAFVFIHLTLNYHEKETVFNRNSISFYLFILK